MAVHIALLRGINVGGHHKLPMKDLRALFTEAGATEVRTYIQSGNVIFEAKSAEVKAICGRVQEAVKAQFGFEVPIVHRSAAQLKKAQADWPFDTEGADPKFLAIGFLDKTPSAARVAALDPQRSPPDIFVVKGQQIYLHFPKGVARSKLSNAWFDAQLQATSTMRNRKTVQALLQMCG